jgi:hypothetical protein
LLGAFLAALLAVSTSRNEPITVYPGEWRLYRYPHTCSLVRRYENNMLLGLFYDRSDRDIEVVIRDPALRVGIGEGYMIDIHLEGYRERPDLGGKAEASVDQDDEGTKRIRFGADMIILAQAQESARLRLYYEGAEIGRFDLDRISPAIDGLKSCIATL